MRYKYKLCYGNNQSGSHHIKKMYPSHVSYGTQNYTVIRDFDFILLCNYCVLNVVQYYVSEN